MDEELKRPLVRTPQELASSLFGGVGDREGGPAGGGTVTRPSLTLAAPSTLVRYIAPLTLVHRRCAFPSAPMETSAGAQFATGVGEGQRTASRPAGPATSSAARLSPASHRTREGLSGPSAIADASQRKEGPSGGVRGSPPASSSARTGQAVRIPGEDAASPGGRGDVEGARPYLELEGPGVISCLWDLLARSRCDGVEGQGPDRQTVHALSERLHNRPAIARS